MLAATALGAPTLSHRPGLTSRCSNSAVDGLARRAEVRGTSKSEHAGHADVDRQLRISSGPTIRETHDNVVEGSLWALGDDALDERLVDLVWGHDINSLGPLAPPRLATGASQPQEQ